MWRLAGLAYLVTLMGSVEAQATTPVAVVETRAVAGPVHGRVVSPWGGGLRGHIVRIGEQRTFTDKEGGFAFADVALSYNVEVIEVIDPKRNVVTAYQGVSTRQPILIHRASDSLLLDDYPRRTQRPQAHGSGSISGKVQLLDDHDRGRERLTFRYVWSDGKHGRSAVSLGQHLMTGEYDRELPDFGPLGGSYCIAVGFPADVIRAMHCDGTLGMTDFSIEPQPQPPQVTVDDQEGTDGMLTWTGPGRVFEVAVGSDYGPGASVYTDKRAFCWTDLERLGVDFRAPGWSLGYWSTAVRVKVTALVPYTSIDDLVSGPGPMAVGTSWQRVESREMHIPLPDDFKVVPLRLESPPKPRRFDPEDPLSVPTCKTPFPRSRASGDLRSVKVDTRVTVRGKLAFGTWLCTQKGCQPNDCCNGCGASWLMVGARDPELGVLLQRSGDTSPLGLGANACHIPKPPSFEVIATGILVSCGDGDDYGDAGLGEVARCLLDEVELCALR